VPELDRRELALLDHEVDPAQREHLERTLLVDLGDILELDDRGVVFLGHGRAQTSRIDSTGARRPACTAGYRPESSVATMTAMQMMTRFSG